MTRPNDPSINKRPPLLPTPKNIYPSSSCGNFDRRYEYQNSKIGSTYDNFRPQLTESNKEIPPYFNSYSYSNYDNFHPQLANPNQEIASHFNPYVFSNYNNIHPQLAYTNQESFPPFNSCSSNATPEPVDPKLDFCSDTFDPEFLLKQPYYKMRNILPYPKAKEYNNLAEYHSHVFLKKDNFKKVEKDRLYDRDYAWYYKILGWDERTQKRFEQRVLRKPKKYKGWISAKLRKYKPHFERDDPNYEPCRSFPPLQSNKIIQLKSKFRKYKIYPRNVVTNSKDLTFENLSDIPETETNIAKDKTILGKTQNDSSDVINSSNSSKITVTAESKNN